jgi:isopentenyldiphosphate isomerase
MEYWDLYNEKREKLNKKHARSSVNKLKPGEYYIAVSIWIINDQNKILLTQRHPQKVFPLKWECTGGALIAGEDSITGALREVEEEIGIKLKKENGKLIFSKKGKTIFKDTYLFRENISINDTTLQETEVVGIKLVAKEELLEMAKNHEIADPIVEDINKLVEMGII